MTKQPHFEPPDNIRDFLSYDHANGDRGDNRIANLRPATMSQNIANTGKRRNNTSGFKGVYLYKPSGRWVAQIVVDYLGTFDTAEDAARAYDAAACQHFDGFARPNFLGSHP